MPTAGKLGSVIGIAIIGVLFGVITMAASEALNAIANNEINTREALSGIAELNRNIKNLCIQQNNPNDRGSGSRTSSPEFSVDLSSSKTQPIRPAPEMDAEKSANFVNSDKVTTIRENFILEKFALSVDNIHEAKALLARAFFNVEYIDSGANSHYLVTNTSSNESHVFNSASAMIEFAKSL
jgi:hypothetical protein